MGRKQKKMLSYIQAPYFISAFFKLLPFSKHFKQQDVCKNKKKRILDFTEHLVDERFIGTDVLQWSSRT